MQAFRSRVHGGRESGGTGAHDGDVEELVVLDRIEHAEAAGKRVFRGIEQHRAVRANHERFGRGRAVLLEQRGGVVSRVASTT